MAYPPQPPQGGGSYQQYLPPGQQAGYGPPQGAPQPPASYGYPQQPQQGYPAPGGYGPAPVDFLSAFGQADLTAGGPPIPGGSYPMVIAEPVEWAPTKAGDKDQWTVKLKVDGGEHAGRQLTKRITITPDSPKAMGMMYRQVAALTGLPHPDPGNPAAPQNQHWAAGGQHLASLMQPGRPVTAEVTLKPRSDDPSRMTNDVEFVHPREQSATPPAAPAQPSLGGYQPGPPAAPQPTQPYQSPQQPQEYGGQPPAQQPQPQPGVQNASPMPTPQQYGAQQAAQPHPGGTGEFAPPQGIGQQAGQNGQPPAPAAPQQGGTLPAPPWAPHQ